MEAQNWCQHWGCASLVLGGRIPPSACWHCFASHSSGCHLPSSCQGTLLVHTQLAVHQVLHQKAAPQTILAQRFVPPQVQDFEFAFGELYEGPVWQFLQGSLGLKQPSVRSGIPPSHLSFLKRCKSRCHLMVSTVFMIYACTDERIPILWNSFVNVQMSFDRHLKGNQFKRKRLFSSQDNVPKDKSAFSL